ncbi:MAG: pyridoxal phosphate-dependent aminotransferase [Pseudomonadota bacterium]
MPVKINPVVAALPDAIPFVAPEEMERTRGRAFAARLGANEGNFGPAPAAVAAMRAAATQDSWTYCDPTAHALRTALSEHLGVDMDDIVCGPGIDGLLGLIVRVFSDVGDTIVSSVGAYPTFNYHVHAYGRALESVPYAAHHEDLDALAAKAREARAAIVYVSNPDNPMGSWWQAADVARFVDAVPDETLIVLDEAYGETAPAGTLPSIDTNRKNLIRLRTFSKAYGLAGLRVGYAFGHRDLVAPFHRARDHFGVNVMAQQAALASLQSQDWLQKTVARIAAGRARIAAIALDNALAPLPSATNFVTVNCGGDGAVARRVMERLLALGIFVRKPMAPGLDHCVRVSVGRDEELDAFEQALPKALE